MLKTPYFEAFDQWLYFRPPGFRLVILWLQLKDKMRIAILLVVHLGLADVDEGGHAVAVGLQDIGPDSPLARRNSTRENRPKHRPMIVESSESRLFLKRNLCLRANPE